MPELTPEEQLVAHSIMSEERHEEIIEKVDECLSRLEVLPESVVEDHREAPDLRGAVYANVVNATMQLFLSWNELK